MCFEKFKKQLPKLKTLISEGKTSALDSASIQAVSELIHNLLNGNFPIDENLLNTLKKVKNKLRKLAKKTTSLKIKKKIILKLLPILNLILVSFLQMINDE